MKNTTLFLLDIIYILYILHHSPLIYLEMSKNITINLQVRIQSDLAAL